MVCDTSSCFHFGGRARDGERLFLEFHYTTSAPFYYNKIPDFPAATGSSGWCSRAEDRHRPSASCRIIAATLSVAMNYEIVPASNSTLRKC